MSAPNDKKENNNFEKQKDPALVPRYGRFFLHDDREKGGRGQRVNVQRRQRVSSRSNVDDGFEWKHDKFEQLVATEPRPTTRNKPNDKPRGNVEDNRTRPTESKPTNNTSSNTSNNTNNNSQRRRRNPNEVSQTSRRPPRTNNNVRTPQKTEPVSGDDSENVSDNEESQDDKSEELSHNEQSLVDRVSNIQLEQQSKPLPPIASPSVEKAVLNPSAREFQPITSPNVDYRDHSTNNVASTAILTSESDSTYAASLQGYDPNSPYYNTPNVDMVTAQGNSSYLVQPPYVVSNVDSYIDQNSLNMNMNMNMMHNMNMYSAAAAAAAAASIAPSMMLYDPNMAAMYYTAPDGTILWYAPTSASAVPTATMLPSTMDMQYYPYPTDNTTTYMSPPPAPIPTTAVIPPSPLAATIIPPDHIQ